MEMKDSKSELRRPAIKKEHVSERLPSLRGKRDLTLGGVPKKSYSPTIPVRKEKVEAAAQNSGTKDEARPQKKKRENKEKGPKHPKKYHNKSVLTSASVFSMGPAEQNSKFGRNSSRVSRDATKAQQAGLFRAVKQDVKQEPMDTSSSFAVDEEEKELDGSCDFSYSQYPPVRLPLDATRHAKQPLKVNKSAKPTASIRPDQASEQPHIPTAAELFLNAEDKAHMLFLQLPDSLPIAVPPQEEPMETDQSNSTKKAPAAGSCDITQLPTGYLGKIQVHKSGRVKLLLGTNSLDVTMGTPCDFQQDLMSIHVDEDGDVQPHMITLGQLSHRLVCLPDLDNLLTNS